MDHLNGIVMISQGACRLSVVWWNYTATLWLRSGFKPGRSTTPSWQSGLCVLVIERYVNTPMNSSPLIRATIVFVHSVVLDTDSKAAKVKYETIHPCSLIQYVEPHWAFTVGFYVVVTFSLCVCKGPSPLKVITVSPHHAALSSQTRRDRRINTPSHPIEHSIQKEEGNTINVEECSRWKELDWAAYLKENSRICTRQLWCSNMSIC